MHSPSALLLPLKTATSKETKSQLENFSSLFGAPKLIIADAGRNFKNLEIAQYLDSWVVSYHYVTPDALHRGNGQGERYMRSIMNLLRVETDIKSEWSNSIWKIQLLLNTTFKKSIKITPMQALLELKATSPLIQTVVQNLPDDIRPVRNINADREKVKKVREWCSKSPKIKFITTK